MSGLEVVAAVAAVAGIVSAFTGSTALYRSWRKKKLRRLINPQNGSLERSLVSGEVTVKQEYDGHFARLGPRFAVGDDRGTAELSQYVIKLQHVIIRLMAESESSSAIVLPNLPMMLSASEDTRTGVVRALAEQYQRLLQSAPLTATGFLAPYRAEEQASGFREIVPIRGSGWIEEAPPVTNTPDCCPGSLMLEPLGSWRCSHCQFKADNSRAGELLKIETTDDNPLGICVKALWGWHEKCDRVGSGDYLYRCRLCQPPGRASTLGKLADHMSSRHTTDDVLRVLRDDTIFLYLQAPEGSRELLYTFFS